MDLAKLLYERSAQTDHLIGEGVEETRQPLHSARHLPGYVYTSPEILALEKEKYSCGIGSAWAASRRSRTRVTT